MKAGQVLTALAIGGITWGLSRLYSLKQLGDQLTYKFLGATRTQTGTLNRGAVNVRIRLTNPTTSGVFIEGIRGTISYGGTPLASYNSNQSFTIKPSGDTDIGLNFITNNAEILNQVVRAALTKNLQPLLVKYDLKTKLGVIPQSFTIGADSVI